MASTLKPLTWFALLLGLFAIGCQTGAGVELCSADCNGALAGVQSCAQLDALRFSGGSPSCDASCQVDTSACQGMTVAEFELCSGSGQGNCRSDLSCYFGICAETCDPTATTDSCGYLRECVGLSSVDPTDGICFNRTAQRDAECFFNGALCADGAGECTFLSQFDAFCKLECASTDVGTPGDCPLGEACLAAPDLLEGQPDAPDCTQEGEVDTCDGDSGYSCIAAGSGLACARAVGWCGLPVPLLGGFGSDALNAYLDAGHACDPYTHHRLCTLSDAEAPTVLAECTVLGPYPVCVAFCGDADGEVSVDLDCGAGFDCGRPPLEEALFFDVERDDFEALVPCTEGDDVPCDGDADYRCVGPLTSAGEFFCARPSAMCLAADD